MIHGTPLTANVTGNVIKMNIVPVCNATKYFPTNNSANSFLELTEMYFLTVNS